MGLAHVCKPKGLVSREAQSENAIRKCDSNRRDSQVRSTGATHKYDQQVRLTSVINRCDSQVRSTGVTHKCDRLNRESESLQVCKARKFTSSQVCAQKTQKIQKTLLNESRQFDNECSTINWCLRVDGNLRLVNLIHFYPKYQLPLVIAR